MQDTGSVPAREVDEAKVKILPFRQSGLIFSWEDSGPNVYVRRPLWEALPQESRRDLCREMIIAKNEKRILIRDERSASTFATCTATGSLRTITNPTELPEEDR